MVAAADSVWELVSDDVDAVAVEWEQVYDCMSMNDA
jgi:hypothetical protein